MQHVKLQIGCLLVIAYIEIVYIRAAMKERIPCNRFFDALMVIAPWAVFFDGLTAFTVNHMASVPPLVNQLGHLLFLILMDMTILVTAAYMADMLVGFRNKKRECLLLGIPGLLSLLLIVGGIGKLHYIQGKTTWYSMGFPVYVCYATLIFYYGSILFLVIARRRFRPATSCWARCPSS